VLAATDHGGLVHLRMARRVLGRPLYWTGAYFFEGILIDCGPPSAAGALLEWLGGREVEALAVTHHHEDHAGGAGLLGAARGLTAAVHSTAVPLLADGFRQEAYRRLAWGRMPRLRARALEGDVTSRSARLRPVFTPGHSPDHVCFYDADREWLFTGDLFLAERLRYLRADEDIHRLIASLEDVAALPLRRVFCAHRGPVADGPAALRRKAEHLGVLRGRVRALLAQGLDEAEVARRAVGREGPMTWLTLGHFSVRNFVRAVARPGPSAGGAAPSARG
jgi:glyoxylase-like metal-dependent hydrolase (beta-lactamase superfamily II)